MATHALVMKSLLPNRVETSTMAGGTADSLVSLLQFALVKDIFSIFIDVMTILAGNPASIWRL